MKIPFEKTSSGLYFAPGDFYIDPKRGVPKAIISHAHADHANPNNGQVWCTGGTARIMEARYKERLKSAFTVCNYRMPFQIGSASIQFYPAGHMLGSSQIIIDYQGVRYCYTGDFKLRNDDSCEPFEIVPCDVLITETTFANPEYDHPDEEVEFDKLKASKGLNLVIGAYNLGKAQRLTLLLNKFLPDRPIMVHEEAVHFHRIYESEGINLGSWSPYNSRLFRRTRGNILIVPPRSLSTYQKRMDVVTTFATGWKNSPFKAHFNFHLSDHADWKEVLHLIQQCGAKEIVTVHGDGTHLKKHLESLSDLHKVMI